MQSPVELHNVYIIKKKKGKNKEEKCNQDSKYVQHHFLPFTFPVILSVNGKYVPEQFFF